MPRRNNIVKHTPFTDSRPDCSTKRSFSSASDAQKSAELAMLENMSLELNTYHCNRCKAWHLTSVK